MKKMNKTYEVPVAEVFEMQAPVVLAYVSEGVGSGNSSTGGDELLGG
jgi:hypothetical protein